RILSLPASLFLVWTLYATLPGAETEKAPSLFNNLRGIVMSCVLALLFAMMCAASASAQPAQPLPAGLDPQNTLVLDTTQGRIIIKLRTDIAPNHAQRLKQLARDHFYDNVPFHRVIDGFMAQTGDGQYGNG